MALTIDHSTYGRVRGCVIRGFAKEKKSKITMEVDGWVQVSLGIFFGKSVPK